MRTHQFMLLVDGPDLQTDQHTKALFEAGCDDALVGAVDGVQYLDFERKRETVGDAVLSAIVDIESAVPGARVIRVADGGLVSISDIAARTERTRESVRLLIKGARGPGGFPAPVTDPRSRYRLWRWSEVQAWMQTALGEPLSDPDLTWYEAVNASLELRRSVTRLPEAERRGLQHLAGLGA